MQRNNFNWFFSIACLLTLFSFVCLLNCNWATSNWMCDATIYICFISSMRKSIGQWLLSSIYPFRQRKNILEPSPLSTVNSSMPEKLLLYFTFFCTNKISFRWITHFERRSRTQLNHHKINTNNNNKKKKRYRSHTADGTESGRRVRVARFMSIEVIILHRTYRITLTVCSFRILLSVVC